MKSAKVAFLCVLVSMTLVSVSLAAPVNYDEGVSGDLDQSNPPVFVLDVGVNMWTGTIGPTPTSNTQDPFVATLPGSMSIVSIHWEYGANDGDVSNFDISGPAAAAPPFGTVLSHIVSSAGDNITDTGFSTVNPILPIVVDGQYTCSVTTGFAIYATTWKITITVTGNALPTEQSTWGKVKALYR